MDDPVKESNKAGTLSFATSGPNARGSQLFINYEDANAQLDDQGFSPFAILTRGMDVAKAVHVEKAKVDQAAAKAQGNEYFLHFPKLSYIKTARCV